MVVYFELGWAILSTICLANVIFGVLIINILSFSRLALVPVVVSVAGAVANGLSFYVYYADNPLINTAVASVFADITWGIQEGGNSFYSYIILSRIIFDRELQIFKGLFWTFIIFIIATRTGITITRAKSILDPSLDLIKTINAFHVGYFTSIAILECVSAFFLLRKFATVRRTSVEASLRSSIFSHLMRNSEVRVASLALMGIARAITYYFQPTVQEASSVLSQIDRFVYTFECLFPIVMIIDLLASKIAAINNNSSSGGRSFPKKRSGYANQPHQRSRTKRRDDEGHMMSSWEETGSRNLVAPFEDRPIEHPPKARSPSAVSQQELVGPDRFDRDQA
ncbi:uncharacterized protein DNG_04382 [Cephalotrichum gorgonifer]|uniref:Uncharacterized protein n=1 Tax=Cephalotrichum gorgonifer TaxID=2041049 RepID=A0AAE8SUV9_9PEZI|nr:uncharacterized protein DNG_04382 [Cephalotrichum gorgonifer]